MPGPLFANIERSALTLTLNLPSFPPRPPLRPTKLLTPKYQLLSAQSPRRATCAPDLRAPTVSFLFSSPTSDNARPHRSHLALVRRRVLLRGPRAGHHFCPPPASPLARRDVLPHQRRLLRPDLRPLSS